MAQEVQNVMKEIRLDKVVLNMGLGKSGDAVEIAKKALGEISNKKVNDRPAKKAIRDWGIRKGEPITLYLPSPRMRRLFEEWLYD